jgi:hypothetical protein
VTSLLRSYQQYLDRLEEDEYRLQCRIIEYVYRKDIPVTCQCGCEGRREHCALFDLY